MRNIVIANILSVFSILTAPDRQQHPGCSGRERPCYSEPHTLVRERSASAVLWDCRKHVPLWCSLVWPDSQFLWTTQQDKRNHLWGRKYYLLNARITINSAHSARLEAIHLLSGSDLALITCFSYWLYRLDRVLLCFEIHGSHLQDHRVVLLYLPTMISMQYLI